MTSGKDGIVLATVNLTDHIISISTDKEKTGDIAVLELYKVDVLCASRFALVGTIIAIVILFAIILVSVLLYLVFNSLKMRKAIMNMETYDIDLGCLNRNGFEKEAQKILERNHGSFFAVVVMHLRHYKYLNETYGTSEVNNLLKYIRILCSKAVGIEETFGYMGSGQFLAVLHAKDRAELLERLKLHAHLVSQYKGSDEYDVLVKYGIYEVREEEDVSLTQMIGFANEANNTATQATEHNAGMVFNFYNDELRKIRLIHEDMELRMESALQNGEFQVFYQPKYNLIKKRQDGSEALVRWYDPRTKEYNRPALFIELFETNGFIVKLDKYVYERVCDYISYSIAHGRTVYPVSVNVSRITAVQPNFVEQYAKIKKRYNIPDGQIMIEFTESFAYENYGTLSTIVAKLHANGFKCSIDDFGSGYSSYRILKELPMDEIKLDKFFLEKGTYAERDEHIFKSIIALAKNLGMKVTQEGVETREDVDRLISLGVDVVQGY
ncbi:MAG: GGDEF domain-containing phosphodiesterase, partial [Clostridia bacterium]|nr:GGDEF domain-containing phosphodiesterase [Clostridia bacterium]